MIDREYNYYLYADELPSAVVIREDKVAMVHYDKGTPIGYYDSFAKQYYIYNHLSLIVQVHETLDDSQAFRIVGFKVEPSS